MNFAKFYTYRNLWKGGFSTKRRGVVCDRFEEGVIINPRFQVSMAGNARARAESVRNVHAYVVSELPAAPVDKWPDNLVEVTYNPYKHKAFVANGRAVLEARAVYFSKGRAYIEASA
jgi:hypothetical protein